MTNANNTIVHKRPMDVFSDKCVLLTIMLDWRVISRITLNGV